VVDRFKGKFDCAFYGRVTDYEPQDEEPFGRVRVVGAGIEPPGKVCYPFATFGGADGRGIWMLPKIGANVLVIFPNGDPMGEAFYVASTWSVVDGEPHRPEESENSADVAVIRFENWVIIMDARSGQAKMTIKDRTSGTFLEIDSENEGDLKTDCKRNETRNVTQDLTQAVTRDMVETVGRDKTETVTRDKVVNVTGSITIKITPNPVAGGIKLMSNGETPKNLVTKDVFAAWANAHDHPDPVSGMTGPPNQLVLPGGIAPNVDEATVTTKTVIAS